MMRTNAFGVLNIIMYGIRRLDEEFNRRWDAWEGAGKKIPSQDEIDEVVACCKQGCIPPDGIAVTELVPGYLLVHWAEDPLVEELVGASLEVLPELLVATVPEIRRLVQIKVDYLISVREERQ